MNSVEENELRTLVEGYVANELGPEQLTALEARLRASEDARLFFLSYLEVHAGLAWEFRGAGAAMPSLQAASASDVIIQPESSVWWKGSALRWALPLAAAVVFFVALARLWQPATPSAPSSIASVKASLHGQWADGSAVAVGTPLPAGIWELQSGLVELETPSGTVLLVEAPASLELIDALHGRLLAGNLVVRMPKGKSGFVVDLPQMRVTDLGTEFGVSVALNGEARVQVYDGKVRAESTSLAGEKELTRGETLRCTTDGRLAAEKFSEDRFIRRFPPSSSKGMPGGPLYSQSTLDSVRIAPPLGPIEIDGDLSEWNRAGEFRSSCLPPYDRTYFVEGLMMYDAENLYIGAHVGDPEPMRNAARDSVDFAGGSVIVRVSTNRALGWPLRSGTRDPRTQGPPAPPFHAALTERVASIIMSHDAQAGQPRLRLQYGFDFRNASDPRGWRGAFRQDADGRGYTLEYAIPWRFLECADNPPQAGDVLAALWMVHWSDADGRVCRGQLVDVTNREAHPFDKVPPYLFFQNGPCWGRALYLPQ